jgi:hypothetical protein
VDSVSGTVVLETTAPLKGLYSARFPNVSGAYMDTKFTATDDLYVSFYVRVYALPSSSLRIAFISNAGTTMGNIMLNANGTLGLRLGSTTIGTSSFALAVGQLYRVGIHQKKGSGNNAVLEAFVAQNDNAFGSPFGVLTNGTWTTGGDRWRIGATAGSATVDMVVDEMKFDAAAMPGPSVAGP